MRSTQKHGIDDTPSRLLLAAERLFADRGIETVSLREISRAAGARNVIAAQYWFKDRDGLIRALLAKHRVEVEFRRHALLDAYEADADDDVRQLAGALVRPLAAKLDDATSGSGYLKMLADLLTRPQPPVAPLELDDPNSSMVRWRGCLEPLLDPAALALHRRFLTVRFVVVELAGRAQAAGRQHHELFVSQLVDAATGLLTAPVSAETNRLRSGRKTS